MQSSQALKLVAKKFEVDEDKDFPPIIQLDAMIGDNRIFSFLPELGADAVEWDNLSIACKKGTRYILDWKPSNGECYIMVALHLVEICVAKYGDGCGGALSINIPAEACIDAFDLASQLSS